MKMGRYLKDRWGLLLFFSLMLLFVALVIATDPGTQMNRSSVRYVLGICSLLLILYLAVDYRAEKRRVSRIQRLLSLEDAVPLLPGPIDSRDEAYQSLLHSQYALHLCASQAAQQEFMDNKEFMTAWAHEIKTPITTAKLLLESGAQDTNTIDSLKEEIEKIERDVERVLYYARSDSFSKDYIIDEQDVRTLARQSVKRHSLLFIHNHIQLQDDLPENFTIYTDGKWLAFILDQLLSNALKYTPPGGRITLKAHVNHTEKILLIEDTGTGIRSEDLPRLFAKSFTGQNGRRENGRATGFGLYLSQKLAKKLGHRITIESQFGRGTTAMIHFPIWNDYYQPGHE